MNAKHNTPQAGTAASPAKRPLYKSLYVQVLVAVTIGVLLGHFNPGLGADMKPLGDGFIKLIKMIIAPSSFARWWWALPAWKT